MSKLLTLLEAVKDRNLTKTQIEEYRDDMVHLHSSMQLELASVEKEEAIFFETFKIADPDATDISVKRKWKASQSGQREIELNRFIKTVAQEIKSLRDRLYSIY